MTSTDTEAGKPAPSAVEHLTLVSHYTLTPIKEPERDYCAVCEANDAPLTHEVKDEYDGGSCPLCGRCVEALRKKSLAAESEQGALLDELRELRTYAVERYGFGIQTVVQCRPDPENPRSKGNRTGSLWRRL